MGQVDPLAELTRAIELSSERRRKRAESVPTITYPDDLPVAQRHEEIARAIEASQVVVVCGETGSGKTTQLPKICLALGRGIDGAIGHTQPRRIAARTVAARVSEELSRPLGQTVGYKVRFGDRVSPDSLVKVMTDGILLAETQSDPLLEQYDTLIIDEAHERSLNIDFLLGYLREVLPRRPDLKIIITSATIDPQRFAMHFAAANESRELVPAPIIEVSGRTYPVEVRYAPLTRGAGSDPDDPDEDEPDMQDSILRAVDEICALDPPEGPKDILIFLSGEREIRETAENLRKRHPSTAPKGSPRIQVLPLYARLSLEEQARVFALPKNSDVRRIVLATNVAETSLTVPGIRYVIDPGFARISRYSPRNKVQRLPIEPISRASADQRAGRCGRLSDGVCIRLYSREDYESRPPFTDPEILRTNLASVMLQMKALRLGRIEHFPFLDPPDERAIRDGLDTLEELGAVDAKGDLTRIGSDLARLPIDPRIGRMVLAACDEGRLDEVVIIAAALSIQDPRERPFDAREQADKAHEAFHAAPGPEAAPGDGGADHSGGVGEQSDFLTYLNLWNAYQERSRHLSTNKLRAWCKANFVSPVRMREWRDVHHQLSELVGALGLRKSRRPAEREGVRRGARVQTEKPASSNADGGSGAFAAIHRALLAGLLSNVATLTDRYEYTGTRGIKASIFPGSTLFKNQPRWIMAAELVRTTRLYARTVARIQPGWIEKVGAHLVKRTYSEPYWNERVAQVWASEKVTFMGLELVPHRRVQFGTIDPVAARQIFIHRALVEREYWSNAPFAKHNRRLIEEAHELQARFRRHDLMADAEALFAFFDARVPASVYSGRAFEQWLRHATEKEPRLLFLSREDLLPTGPGEPTPEDFPDTMDFGGARIPLEYKFCPGEPEDGVTLVIPLALLAAVRAERCEWLVPGLIREKIIALMRTLPKDVRRLLVPAPQYADKALRDMRFGEGPLLPSLSSALSRLSGEPVQPANFGTAELPDHLRLRFRVEEGDGADKRTVAEGRDLAAIRSSLRESLAAGFAGADESETSDWNRDGLSTWDFEDLPETVPVSRAGLTATGYPAIVDPAATPMRGLAPPKAQSNGSVSLRIVESRERAERLTSLGLRRLFALRVRDEVLFLIRNAPGYDRLALQFGVLGALRDLEDGLILIVAQRAFLSQPGEVRTRAQFETRLDAGWHRLGEVVGDAVGLVRQILEAHQALQLRLESAHSPALAPAFRDVREHASVLLASGFLANTPYEALTHFPRYLRAALMRLEKLSTRGVARDEEMAAQVRSVWQTWTERARKRAADGIEDPALERFRWLIEEWRVSLFAQELGTAEPVSVQRLEKRWAEVRI